MAAKNGNSNASNGNGAFDWDSFDGNAFLREHRDEWREETARFQKDWKWFIKNKELVHQSPHRWVAIYGQRIVAAADTPEEMRQELIAQGLEPGKTLRVPFGGRGGSGRSAS